MSDRKIVYGDGTLTKIAFSDHARDISGQTQQTIFTVTNQGPQGAAGDSVQSLEPRIVALEVEVPANKVELTQNYGDHTFDYVDFINTLLS